MCIIAIKNKGVEFPNTETIEAMFKNNSDGAGLTWMEKGKVHICKGLMTLDDFNKKITQLGKRLCLKEVPMILHFRIATHGGVSKEMTHPFPISESPNEMGKLNMKTKIAVVHNGVISITPRDKTLSDTAEYICARLSLISKIKPNFYEDKLCKELIKREITSKMAFLTTAGKIYMIGDFVTDDSTGMIYSNDSYKPRTYIYSHYSGNYDWESYYAGKYGSQTSLAVAQRATNSKWDDDDDDFKGWGDYWKKESKLKEGVESSKMMGAWLDDELCCISDRKSGEWFEANGFVIDRKYNVYEYDFENNIAIRRDNLSACAYYTGCDLYENGLEQEFDWTIEEDLV